ncbi:bifunctional adenosylcobinamide kinase/adenosylcobinamide-phosphate guanylyltransferase [Shimia biformata]|uniref:bifunctional adenosylcobinamide kinase/adenosylcobinamide-phosphate guanylyltransferase n=1 Tax=Shimia biformata TaxID=1294299 RepID=UPI003B82DE56
MPTSGRSRYYLATAQSFDDEMTRKVAEHVAARGVGWITIETPFDLAGAVAQLPADSTALVDCATMWLTNHLLADHDIAAETARLLAALSDCKAEIIVVSNEVGAGIVPDNALSRRFREAQGKLNQQLAALSDRAALVAAGLPVVLKGTFP